jgi:ATP-binding cassette subfamily C protein
MKYQVIRQYSEEDCGAACLATVIRHYQKTLTLNRIREAVGTGQLGTTLLGLRQGAESLGFNARAVKASNEVFHCLERVTLPAIIHWKGEHWVVLYGQKGKKYIIADPALSLIHI